MFQIVLERQTVHLPSLTQPEPWVSSRQLVSNAHVPLVSSKFWNDDKKVQAAIDSGTMAESIRALNAAQNTGYRVNGFVLDVVQACYDQDIDVKGLPMFIEGDFENHVEIEKRNKAIENERVSYDLDVAIARQFAGAPFWTPMRFDYRGRLYNLSRFNFQKNKVIRGLFEFHRGEVLNADGLYSSRCISRMRVTFLRSRRSRLMPAWRG